MHDIICSPFVCLASQAFSIQVNKAGQTLLFGYEGNQHCISHTCLSKRTPRWSCLVYTACWGGFVFHAIPWKVLSHSFSGTVLVGMGQKHAVNALTVKKYNHVPMFLCYLAILFTGTHIIAVFHPGPPLTWPAWSNL